MIHGPSLPADISIETAERMLDRLAVEIEALGDDGHKILPLYQWLDDETHALRKKQDVMSSVRERARRSMDRTSVQSAPARRASM